MKISLLTPGELELFSKHGWKILNEDSAKYIYAYLPDDDDDCKEHGIEHVRMALDDLIEYVKRTELIKRTPLLSKYENKSS